MNTALIVLVTFANSRAIYLDLVSDCPAKCCVDVYVSSVQVEHQKSVRNHSFSMYTTFPKNYNFLPLDTHTYLRLSGGMKC